MAGENIGFRIPLNYLVDYGYPTHPAIDVIPTRGLSSKNTSRYTEMSAFSVSHRTSIGINPNDTEFNASFLSVDASEASYIEAFFRVNKGVKPFNFYLPYEFSYRTSGGSPAASSVLSITEAPIYDVYPDATVESETSLITLPIGTKITSIIDEFNFNLNITDAIPTSTPIKITNVKKLYEVVCTQWAVSARYKDLYDINAVFKKVYSAKQRYTPVEGDIL